MPSILFALRFLLLYCNEFRQMLSRLSHARRLSRQQSAPPAHRYSEESSWGACCVVAPYAVKHTTRARLRGAQPRSIAAKKSKPVLESAIYRQIQRSNFPISISPIHRERSRTQLWYTSTVHNNCIQVLRLVLILLLFVINQNGCTF